MSQFDNHYLCPKCGHVDELHPNNLICEICDFNPCFVAKHINEGDRKWWIRIEEDGGKWRRKKNLSSKLKKHLPEDKNLVKEFQKIVGELFGYLDQNKENMDSIFPKWTRDYSRTTGKRTQQGWKEKRSAKKVKQSSVRGKLYEGAFNEAIKQNEQFEQIFTPISYSYNGKEFEFEPDAWLWLENSQIPVEFKTFEEGKMVPNKFNRGLKQSRKYAKHSKLLGKNPKEYSALIICCPEERKFASALIDNRIEKIL